MGTDIEKLVDLMIQERMQSQFAKWREAETGTEKKEDCLRLENEYEKAISLSAFLPLGRIVRLRLGLSSHVVGIFEHFGQAQYPQKCREVL